MKTVYENKITEHVIKQSTGLAKFNTALFRPLTKKAPFKLIVRALEGCTTLIVMSPKAVYYTHSFEMRSFPLENNLPEDEEQLKAGVKPDFQGEVIDLLQKGRKDPLAGGITNAQQPLASYVNKFKGMYFSLL
jgi:hypothetical protein